MSSYFNMSSSSSIITLSNLLTQIWLHTNAYTNDIAKHVRYSSKIQLEVLKEDSDSTVDIYMKKISNKRL